SHFLTFVIHIFSMLCLFYYAYRHHRDLHSFPTRRSSDLSGVECTYAVSCRAKPHIHTYIHVTPSRMVYAYIRVVTTRMYAYTMRSEEHTSELQSRENLVCRLLLEKKKKKTNNKKT